MTVLSPPYANPQVSPSEWEYIIGFISPVEIVTNLTHPFLNPTTASLPLPSIPLIKLPN